MKIKNSHYVGLQGWQVNELNLRGSELIIYAMIYQYRNFILDVEQFGEWTGLDEDGVEKIINRLIKSGLIKASKKTVKGTSQVDIILSPTYEEEDRR